MVFVACAIAVLSLVSVSHTAPLACEELVRPLDQLDPRCLEGRWALVAASMKNNADAEGSKGVESIALDIHGSFYTQVNRFGGQCEYHPINFTLEGHTFAMKRESFNFTGTFLRTSCQDCLVFSLDVESPTSKSMDVYLVSRRREVGRAQMEEFRAQVACLSMPPPFEKDPRKELCPEQAAKPEEDAGGQ